MKKKLALLLASVMTLSTVSVNLFAATDIELTKTPSTLPEKTLFVEQDMVRSGDGLLIGGPNVSSLFTDVVSNGALTAVYRNNAGPIDDQDDIKYVVDGADLLIRLKGRVQYGDSIRIKLTNAKWFFRNQANEATYGDLQVAKGKAADKAVITMNGTQRSFETVKPILATEKFAPQTRDSRIKYSTEPVSTYDLTRGAYVPSTDIRGTYYRFNGGVAEGNRQEVPYTLEVDGSNESAAVITIMGNGDGPDGNYVTAGDGVTLAADKMQEAGNIIRIPMIVRATETESVTVEIVSSNLTTISQGTRYQLAQSSSTATKTSVYDPETARDEIEIDKLIISETRMNSMESGWFAITAPSGFEFSDNINKVNKDKSNIVELNLESGLKWRRSQDTGTGVKGRIVVDSSSTSGSYYNNNSGYTYYTSYGNSGNVNVPILSSNAGGETEPAYNYTGSGYTNNADYGIRFKRLSNGEMDRSVLETYINIEPSTSLQGSIYFTGLVLLADEGAPWGDIIGRIENLRDSEVVTEESFKLGTRADWTIMFTTAGDIPTLTNGRYVDEDPANPSDKEHKTAEIVFKENSTNAWFSGRTVDFTLSEGARVRKMRVVTAEKFDESDRNGLDQNKNLKEPNIGVIPSMKYLVSSYRDSSGNTSTGYHGGDYGKYYYPNDGVKHGFVTIDGDVISFSNLSIQQNKKAELRMHLWVSIVSGFEGDLKLSATKSAIPSENTLEPITIAKVVSPITVTSKVTDVKIGYQYYKTHDIAIAETASGMLKKGKTLNLSITDYIDNDDMRFTPGATYEVTAGDIKIKNFETLTVGSATGDLGATARGIRFDINSASTKASTITIQNVQVKIDRTIPESSKPYQVLAWGTAVAENYGPKRDQFQRVAGIGADYIKVVTSANDKGGVLANVVKVTIDDPVIQVGPDTYTMDTTAYISADSNSTMVPVRFIAVALGVNPEKVNWDKNQRTVTVDASQTNSTRIIQFTIGSDQILVNGIATTMYSPDGLAVKAEIKDGRSFIPMRALGTALGVNVGWDADTRTATYNPEKADGEVAATTAE